jgi:hypothetical protein
MSDWRNIWKESIRACQNTVKNNDRKCKFDFKELENKYPNDKMIQFEKGIALECLGCKEDARIIYTNVSDENSGLPIKHWRTVASLFLKRVSEKKQGKVYSEKIVENFNKTDLADVQWTSFYYLHTFIYLPDHIRYLAISSMSRIDSEPEMVIVIFRTCLEEVMHNLHPTEYKKIIENNREDLFKLLLYLYNEGNGKLISQNPDKECLENENNLSHEIRIRGNDAAHGNILNYTPSYLIDTICYFIELMDISNKAFQKNIKI